jgi:hypothetical protein
MYLTGIEQMLIGAWLLQTISAAVSAMNKPKKDYGAYLYMYRFLHQMTNSLDSWFESKFNVAMPRVVDETAVQKITTPSTTTEIAVTKTTKEVPTNPI